MKFIPLPPESRWFGKATHKAILTYADLASNASATKTVAIAPGGTATLPAGTVVQVVGVNLITPFDFSDAAINSCAITIGDGGSNNRFCVSTELAADGSYVSYFAPCAATAPYAYLVADTVDTFWTVSGGGSATTEEATSGEVEIYLWVVDLNDLERAK